MKILVISDIHGNLENSVFDYASSSDLTLCLGDLTNLEEITDECLDFILELSGACPLQMIPGNCDTDCLQTFLDNNQKISIHKSVKEFGGYLFSGFGGTVDAITHARLSRAHFLCGSESFFNTIHSHLEKSSWLQKFLDNIGIVIEGHNFKVIPENAELIKKYEGLSSPCEFKEHEIRDFFVNLAMDSNIWILHTPPFGFPGSERLGGLSIGSRGVLEAITALQPRLTISGHIHRAGEWKLGHTLCISAPAMMDNLVSLINIDPEHNISHEVVKLR